MPVKLGAPHPDLEVMASFSSPAVRVFRGAALLVGLFVGLRVALPDAAVSLLAVIEIAGVILAFWLIAEGALAKAQSLSRRERPAPPHAGNGSPPPTATDPLLTAASWGTPATGTDDEPAPPAPTTEAPRTVQGDAIVDPLLMAASWGSAGPADTRQHSTPVPTNAPDAKEEKTSPVTPNGADPLLAAASWSAPSKPSVAGTRRKIDVRVLPRLRLPSLRLPSPSRLLPSGQRAGARRAVHVTLLLVGVVVGLLWALPIADVSKLCPPEGEGQVMCTIQKAWLAALVQFAAPIVGAQLLAVVALRTVPATIRRWRAGERLARRATAAPSEHFADDPALRAAAWGRTGADDAEPERSPDRELVERVRSPRVVPVRSAPRARDHG